MKSRTKWQRVRRRMCRARMDKGELNCPCCGRVMFFIKNEDWQTYAARHEAMHDTSPSKWPEKIGRALATVDHLIPRIRGGTDHPRNLFVMCGTCNQEKDDKTASEWIAWRKDQGRPLDPIVTARLLKRERKARRVCGMLPPVNETTKRKL